MIKQIDGKIINWQLSLKYKWTPFKAAKLIWVPQDPRGKTIKIRLTGLSSPRLLELVFSTQHWHLLGFHFLDSASSLTSLLEFERGKIILNSLKTLIWLLTLYSICLLYIRSADIFLSLNLTPGGWRSMQCTQQVSDKLSGSGAVVLQGPKRSHKVPQGPTRSHRAQQGPTQSCKVLQPRIPQYSQPRIPQYQVSTIQDEKDS